MNNKLISIIVPVYNAETYLKKTVNSILLQTYDNFELILVDDGSKDGSLSICKELEMKDKRVRTFHKDNGGVSSARNLGLKKANGTYVYFMDSDDTINESTLELLYNQIISGEYDICVCGYNIIENDVITKTNKPNISDEYDIKNDEEKKLYIDKLVNNGGVYGYTWNKLYRKSAINNIVFDESASICEDLLFNLSMVEYINKVTFVNAALYNYIQRKNSALNNKKINKNGINAYPEIIKILQKNRIDSLKYKLIYIKEGYEILKSGYDYDIIKNISEFSKKEIILSKYSLKIRIKEFLYKKIYLIFVLKRMYRNIGIITIDDITNYGNRLQNYALQEYLKKKYCNVRTIKISKSEKNLIVEKIKRVAIDIIKLVSPKKKYKKYNNFRYFNKKIKYSRIIKEYNLSSLNKNYDFFIVGSDQVWNPYFGLQDISLLTFVNDNDKKIAFSASFGVNELPDEKKNRMGKYINDFKKISVREEAGKKILEPLTKRNDIEVLVDPTMLLASAEWDKVSKKPKHLKSKKYVLNYFLGELSSERKKEIEDFAKRNDCDIINLLDEKDSLYESGPAEFLYLEKNAFLICTDSFHSSVFAIIYDRPFVVFDREQEGIASMNSRIDTLISKLNLKNRRYNETNITNENLKHDYSEAYKILEEERKKSRIFIDEILK